MRVDLPEYPSEDVLREKLLQALPAALLPSCFFTSSASNARLLVSVSCG